MELLSKAEIEDIKDLQTREVEVPEWPKDGKPGRVLVREPDAWDQEEYDQSLVHTEMVNGKAQVITNYKNAKARLVAKCVVDADGNRLFTDADAEWLGRKSCRAVTRLYKVIQELAGKATGDEKRAEKNSGETPDSPSSTT